jgi:predicted DNA binding CopG/RHH family protein
MKKRLKKLPALHSDAEAEKFLDTSDLSEYDLSGMVPMQDFLASFELKPKNRTINLRLSGQLLNAIKKEAATTGMPYQRFIRVTLERAVLGQRHHTRE